MVAKWILSGCLVACVSGASAQVSVQQALRLRGDVPSRPVLAKAPLPQSPTVADALTDMAAQADVVFAGEVVKVEQKGNAFQVTFHVETAVRGASAGGSYTLREWAGLWSNGQVRYRVGQRMLVLLHAPSIAGFSSPVGGQDGLIPLHGNAITGELDTRWLATRVMHGRQRIAMHALAEGTLSAPKEAQLVSAAPDPAATMDCSFALDVLRALAQAASEKERR